jgi:hypothetical protein
MARTTDYQIFLFDCEWYDEYEDKELNPRGLLMAPDFAQAVKAITERFPWCDNIHIKMYDDTQFIFLNEQLYNRISDPNDRYGLDYPTETVTIERCGIDHNSIPVSSEEDEYWDEQDRHRTYPYHDDPEDEDDEIEW